MTPPPRVTTPCWAACTSPALCPGWTVSSFQWILRSDISVIIMLFPSFAIKEAQYLEAVPGWDSGVGSDCWPGLDMESGEVIGGEFASEGSGVLASEAREQSGCTCDDTQQPDHVKVLELVFHSHIISLRSSSPSRRSP